MSDIRVTTVEDELDGGDVSDVAISSFDGLLYTPSLLLDNGTDTPPAGTRAGTLLFQKGA